MEERRLLEQLEATAAEAGIGIRMDDGDFEGGLCVMGGSRIFVINRQLPVRARIRLLCRGLSTVDLSGQFILPSVREAIRRGGQAPGPAGAGGRAQGRSSRRRARSASMRAI